MEYIVAPIIILILIFAFLTLVPLRLWISALASGVRVSIFTLIGMRIRRVSPARIVNPLIKAEKAGMQLEIRKMEAHVLAGGNIDRVINRSSPRRARTSIWRLRKPARSTWPDATCCRPCR